LEKNIRYHNGFLAGGGAGTWKYNTQTQSWSAYD